MLDNSTSHSAFEEIKAFSVERFSVLLSHVLMHAEKTCIQKASDTSLDAEEMASVQKTQLFLQRNGQNILTDFVKEYKQLLTGEKSFSDSENNTLSLSLVDESTLEEMITIGELTGKVQEHYDLHLKTIKRGIVRLAKQMDFEPEPDAVTPKKLALLLHAPLNTEELTSDEKELIYKAFADIADLEINEIYDGILGLLQDHKVIKETENPASENFKIIYQYRQNQRSRKRVEAVSKNLPPLPADSPLAPANIAPVAANAIDAALFNDSELSQSLYSILSSTSGPSGSGPATDPSQQALPTVDTSELLTLLSNMQNLDTAELAQASVDNASAVSDMVNKTVSSKIKEWSKNLSGPEGNVIELVNNMFVTILEDPDLPDPVKVQTSRLQIPYIKVALLDITLLNQTTHPARLLLNELSQLGARINPANGSKLLDLISDITQSIISNFETDLNIFAESLKRLRETAQSEQKNLEDTEQSTRKKAEAQARVLHLKGIIVSKLRQFLKSKLLPNELHPLVLKGFAPLLLRIYNREGEDSQNWHDTADIFRQIIESVQPRDSLYQLGLIVERSKNIIEKTKLILQQLPQKQTDKNLLSALESIYRQNTEKYKDQQENSFPSLEEDTKDPFDFVDEDAEDNAELLDRPDPIELPDMIKVGIWCEVYLGRDQDAYRMKLASILTDSEQLVFIDISGEYAEIKNVRTFLDELDCERSKIIQDNNLFEKALSAVVSNMQMMRAAS